MTILEQVAAGIHKELHGLFKVPVSDRALQDAARAAVEAMISPSEAMLTAAVGALKAHIDSLPAEVRARSREKGGVLFVGPVEKHTVRFQAMMRAILDETPDATKGPDREANRAG